MNRTATWAFLLIVIILTTSLVMTSTLTPGASQISPSVSYYEGIHPQFSLIFHEAKYYSNDNPYGASDCRIHPGSINFDPDDWQEGKPNLGGEIRDIQIIRDLSKYVPEDTYTHILNLFNLGANSIQPEKPYKTYTWDLEDGSKAVSMDLWLCSFDVDLWISADSPTFGFHSTPIERANQRYHGTEVWLKLQVQPDWIIEGVSAPNFAIGYIEVAQFEQYLNPEVSSTWARDNQLQIIPQSKWAAASLYPVPSGLEGKTDEEKLKAAMSQGAVNNIGSEVTKYQGHELNSALFSKEWFIPITLQDMGTFNYNGWDGSYNTDSIKLKFLVHVFVFGQWTLKPEIERDMQIHVSQINVGWLTQLGFFLSSWEGQLFMLALGILIVIIILWFTGLLGPLLNYLGARKYAAALKPPPKRGKGGG